jgi:DNA-binding response OmpR family regulator
VKKILIVDDVPDVAELLGIFLKNEGYEVRCAYSGPTAIACAALFRPEAVLLDINMPEVSGYDVVRALRNHARAPRPVIVAVSALADESDRVAARLVGFDHFLKKPVEHASLLRLLSDRQGAQP